MTAQPGSLGACLSHVPVALKFGTSGRRGRVADLTQLEIYLNVTAELQYLQSRPAAAGGVARGEDFYVACDLRPSSTQFVPAERGRGELTQAVMQALMDAGMRPVFLGPLPTPALAAYALARQRGSIMVTGSHIPFDRNGYKTNTSRGELRKEDEVPIQERVQATRRQLYAAPFGESPFDDRGMFKRGHAELPRAEGAAAEAFLRRYTDFFPAGGLEGKRLLVYQHSAVGRDLLVELLIRLGAEVVPSGRSEAFVPIDTENIDESQLGVIQSLLTQAWKERGPIDAVVSTDGDSDRPLILGVDPEPGCGPGRVGFFGGDLVGIIVAEFLGADAVVVPISCNDAVDRATPSSVLEPKTRIGSPHVIAGMATALAKGRKAVCGWEANGGFLTGSDFDLGKMRLPALPTRDAFLPILAVLLSAAAKGKSVCDRFAELPGRHSRAALLKNFPNSAGLRLVQRYSPTNPEVRDVRFKAGRVFGESATGSDLVSATAASDDLLAIRRELASFFTSELGFGEIERLNYVDGVRIYFDNGDVAHFRPSGNADELRIYAVADTRERASAITALGVAEPDGILRRLEQALS